MADQFHVAWTADMFSPDGKPCFRDIGQSVLAAYTAIRSRILDEHRPEVGSDQIAGAQGVVVIAPRVTAASLAQAENLLAISRFGVGYDSVDVAACTRAGVALCITTGAVDGAVAEATICWMLALSHQVFIKDRLVREARWDRRPFHMGQELRDRTLGIVGLGGIGRALVGLAAGFGMRQPLASDPFIEPGAAAALGVRLVELDVLLAESDFVSIHCPLSPATRGLIGARELAKMRPEAYLINTARGGIVDEGALYAALVERRIAGAAIDCFDGEPLTAPPRLAELDNVILAPHAIAWTDEGFRDIGTAACQALVDLAHGVRPRHVVNAAVLDEPSFQEKWRRLRLD